jgi:beta-lactamase superfamily II metal-dependent hydrolase
MKFIRTFHPVGQGAFYTERHILDGEEFNIVYDCGSDSIKVLKKEIESTFCKNQEIDVLFISHFHNDHVNGIDFIKDHCKIKRVVMPFVDDEAKKLLLILNRLTGGRDLVLRDLMDNSESFFGEGTEIIRIKKVSGSKDKEQTPEPYQIKKSGNSKTPSSKPLSSGTEFTINVDAPIWFYIPYNFDAEEKRKKFLENSVVPWKDIAYEDVIKEVDRHRKEIRKEYEDIGDLDENSMVLFSGKKDKDSIICDGHCLAKKIENSGCLYTGDINLQNGIAKNIKEELKDVFDKIGTLQVPHHGSVRYFYSSILDGNTIKCAIISCGAKNSYGHPSARVIEELRVRSVSVHCVTEHLTSMVIQMKR